MRYFPDVTRAAAAVEALAQSHRWTRAEIEDYQARRLRAVVRHAAENVPYYGRLLAEAGVRPEDIRCPADLPRIPVTNRADLQGRPASDIVARGLDPGRLVLHSTSGTSGEPLRILRTPFEEYLLRAFRLKQQLLAGMRPFDVRWGPAGAHTRPRSLERAPRDGLLSHLLGARTNGRLDFQATDQQMLASLRAAEPHALAGPASTFAWLSGLLEPGDRALSRLRYVETSGETCTAEMRRQMAENLGVPIYDFYCSHEFNLLAWECPAAGHYHVADWNLILEVVDKERPVRPGEQGEVVATGLHSFAMPFIRYRLNDLVVRGGVGCACGSPASTLRGILGRTIEMFHLPDGRRVHPYAALRPLLSSTEWIRRYQIVQDRPGHILIKVVPAAPQPPAVLEAAAARVAGSLGRGVTVDVVEVAEIRTCGNGKYRPFYNLVAAPDDALARPRTLAGG